MPPKLEKGKSLAPAPTFLLPDLPDRVWAADQVVKRDPDPAYEAKGLWRNDYLAGCRMMGIRPHPCLLPLEPSLVGTAHISAITAPSWKETKHAEEEEEETAGKVADRTEEHRHFDFSAHEGIRVAGWQLGQADILAMCFALKHSLHTTTVELHNAGLTTQQIVQLAKLLPSTTVRSVSVDFNPLESPWLIVESPGAPTLVSARPSSAKGAPTVTTAPAVQPGADASGEASGVSRTHAFAILLRRTTGLVKVTLRGNNLTVSDAVPMADALRYNGTLQELNLGNNKLGDAGVAALMRGVRDNRTLLMLSLANNGLTESR